MTIEEIEAWAAAEENYVEAMARHAAWREARAAAEQEEKSRLGHEAQAAKVEALKQKAEEKRRAEEKRKEEEQLHLLKEQEDAAEEKRLAHLKAKEDADATEKLKEQVEAMDKKKKDNLRKKEKKNAARKLRREQKKKEKAAQASDSGRLLDLEELLREEKGSDADTKEEVSESSKQEALKKMKDIQDGKRRVMVPAGSAGEKNRKRKQATKSASVVEESDGGVRQGPSKRANVEVLRPAEGEEELLGSSKCISLVGP